MGNLKTSFNNSSMKNKQISKMISLKFIRIAWTRKQRSRLSHAHAESQSFRTGALLIVDPPTFAEKKSDRSLDSLFSTAANCFGKVVRLYLNISSEQGDCQVTPPHGEKIGPLDLFCFQRLRLAFDMQSVLPERFFRAGWLVYRVEVHLFHSECAAFLLLSLFCSARETRARL